VAAAVHTPRTLPNLKAESTSLQRSEGDRIQLARSSLPLSRLSVARWGLAPRCRRGLGCLRSLFELSCMHAHSQAGLHFPSSLDTRCNWDLTRHASRCTSAHPEATSSTQRCVMRTNGVWVESRVEPLYRPTIHRLLARHHDAAPSLRYRSPPIPQVKRIPQMALRTRHSAHGTPHTTFRTRFRRRHSTHGILPVSRSCKHRPQTPASNARHAGKPSSARLKRPPGGKALKRPPQTPARRESSCWMAAIHDRILASSWGSSLNM